MQNKLKRQSGITLVEVTASIALFGALVAGSTAIIKNTLADTKAQVAAQYMQYVGTAASAYISDNSAVISAQVSAGNPYTIGMYALQNSGTAGYLNKNISTTNGYGQTVCVVITMQTGLTNLQALVVTTGGTAMQDSDLATASNTIGASGGAFYTNLPEKGNTSAVLGSGAAFNFPASTFGSSGDCATTAASNPTLTTVSAGGVAMTAGHPVLSLWFTPATASTASTASTAGGTQYWKQSVATSSALPTTGNTSGDGRLALDTNKPFRWNSITSAWDELFSNNETATTSIGVVSGKTGIYNVFTGFAAGQNNESSDNVFTGFQAGKNSIYGNENVFTGAFAGQNNTGGGDNVFTGAFAGQNQESSSDNVYVGYAAGNSDTDMNNVFIGSQAGYSTRNGSDNVFTGFQAGHDNSGNSYNVFTGSQAGYSSTGSSNVYTGYYAGYNNTGSYGVYIGLGAGAAGVSIGLGPSSYGTGNIGIGVAAGPFDASLNNTTSIGMNAKATDSNTIRLGNSDIVTIGGEVAWTAASDRRLKTNIHHSLLGLDFIKKLNPVEYNLKTSPTIPQTGFIAQEVESIAPTFSAVKKPKTNKDFYGLTYTDFIPPMVNAIQELDAKVAQLPQVKIADVTNQLSALKVIIGFLAVLLLLTILTIAILWKKVCHLEKLIPSVLSQ